MKIKRFKVDNAYSQSSVTVRVQSTTIRTVFEHVHSKAALQLEFGKVLAAKLTGAACIGFQVDSKRSRTVADDDPRKHPASALTIVRHVLRAIEHLWISEQPDRLYVFAFEEGKQSLYRFLNRLYAEKLTELGYTSVDMSMSIPKSIRDEQDPEPLLLVYEKAK